MVTLSEAGSPPLAEGGRLHPFESVAALDLVVALLQIEHLFLPCQHLALVACSLKLEVFFGTQVILDVSEASAPVTVKLADAIRWQAQFPDDRAECSPLLEEAEHQGGEITIGRASYCDARPGELLSLGHQHRHLGGIEPPDAVIASCRVKPHSLESPDAGHCHTQGPRDLAPRDPPCRGRVLLTNHLFPPHFTHLPPNSTGGNPARQRRNGRGISRSPAPGERNDHMTDKQLSAFGEKLYEAILMTPLPAGMVFAIATAIRQGVPWARLAPPLKLAVFRDRLELQPGGSG